MKDKHHILHNRQEWSLRPHAVALREGFPTLIPRIYREDHQDTHSNVPSVPLLGYHALSRTLSVFEEGSTTLESMDNLMLAIEQAANHPKAHIIEKHLAELAIWSIDLQRPFMAEATDTSRIIIR